MSDPYAGRNPYEPTGPLPPPPPAQPWSAQTPYGPPPGQCAPVPGPPPQGLPGYPPPSPYGPPPGAGYFLPQPLDPRQQAYQQGLQAAQKSRLAAGLLALFLGTLGIHNFYLGRTGIAVLQLLLSVLSLGFLAGGVALWALIEAILILTGSASFATDAKGIPLRG